MSRWKPEGDRIFDANGDEMQVRRVHNQVRSHDVLRLVAAVDLALVKAELWIFRALVWFLICGVVILAIIVGAALVVLMLS